MDKKQIDMLSVHLESIHTLVCANGAENYAHELARINGYSLPECFPRKGMVNHFRDNLEADSVTNRASR
jgi:hypothetical protein